ncbi:MAG: hypothetical protein K6357_06945 [Elusimicrobiota bacterium]
MKKIKVLMLLVFSLTGVLPSFVEAYFDGGINYVTGKDGYNGQDLYLTIGGDNWWVKPGYSSWDRDSIDEKFSVFGAKIGFEKETYTLSFGASTTPEKNYYKNVSVSGDITFSLNPTSSSRKRIAGPNSGPASKSASGVTQIDIGGQVNLTAHTYTDSDKDLKELDISLFAGAKVFMVNLSANYTFSSYDDNDLSKQKAPGTLRLYGMSSYFGSFTKSNFNFKIDIPGSPFVTPFVSYNRVKFTDDTDDLDVYGIGGYIDLNMVRATVKYETYKNGDKRSNFISVAAGLSF